MNKKILMIFIIFSVFISIGAVSADNTTDSVVDALSAADGDTSFAALNALINSGDDVIDITDDYAFDNESDAAFIEGIQIAGDIVINGNNHTIDAKGQSRIFYNYESNVVIKDLIFKNACGCAIITHGHLMTSNVEFNNCISDEGAAVYVFETEYISENDRFIDNFATDYPGGAIFATGSNMTLTNGYFTGNYAENGGAICSVDSAAVIDDCLFEGNSAKKGSSIYSENSLLNIDNSLFRDNHNNWSAVYLTQSTVTVSDTVFINSTSKYATALFGTKSIVNIKKSSFVNLGADLTAGALAFKQANDVLIQDCEFINVSSAKNGGAILIDAKGDQLTARLSNTLLENCFSGFGGAFLQLGGNLSIDASNFTNNFADFNGGAIYLSDTNSEINDCLFTENKVNVTYEGYPTYGGALFSDYTNLTLCSSEFNSNCAVNGSAVFMYDTEFDFKNLEFNDNGNAVYAVFSGGTLYKIDGTDDIYEDDFNHTVYYDVVDGRGMEITLLNSTINITAIPPRYDLREENLVTSVKDQGYMGSCWAFGANAALESALIKAMNYTADLSENNMRNLMLYYSIVGSKSIIELGFNLNSIAYLVSWLGAFPNDYDDYDELGKISPIMMPSEDIHVQDVIIIPHTPGDKDSIDNVKKAILTYGGLTGYLLSKATADDGSPTKYYNEDTFAEYVPDHVISNHAICVVGWDDGFSKDKFTITPPGDGAWICKNSWGTDWGDNGYFYVSYYDQTLCAFPEKIAESFVAFVLNNTVRYDRNYQYDFSGLTMFYKQNDTNLTYFNDYESYWDDLIAAVGTYFEREGIEYMIQIKVNDESVYNQTGISPYCGYHTIELDQYVPIKNGDNFTVAITSNAVPVCYNGRAHLKANTTQVLFQNGSCEDFGAGGMAACLKVYTIEDKRQNTTLITPQRVISVNDGVNGYDYQFILKDENGTALAGKEVSVSFNGKVQTVTTDEKGWGTATLNANEEGSYDVEVTFEGDSDYFGISQKATVKLVREKTSFVAPDRTVYVQQMSRGYTYSAILKDANGKALANRKVLFKFNGESIVTYTDENGYATVKLTAVEAGTQTVTIRFAGDRYYRETQTTRTIKIVRESTKLTVPDKVFSSGDLPKKVNAILTSKSGNPVDGGKVSLSVGGKTYYATTNKLGVAVFSIDLTKLGIFTATAKFADSRFFAATGTSSKITII